MKFSIDIDSYIFMKRSELDNGGVYQVCAFYYDGNNGAYVGLYNIATRVYLEIHEIDLSHMHIEVIEDEIQAKLMAQ